MKNAAAVLGGFALFFGGPVFLFALAAGPWPQLLYILALIGAFTICIGGGYVLFIKK